MRQNIISTLAIMAFLLSGCPSDYGDELSLPKSPEIMIDLGDSGIDIWQEVSATRDGASLTAPVNDAVESVGVFALNNTAEPSVFENQQFYNIVSKLLDATPELTALKTSWSTKSNNWPYTPEKKWVANANYAFVAYTPYSATDVRITKGTGNDITEMVWEGLSSIAAADYLVTTRVDYTAASSSNPVMSMSMNHLMARLRFCFEMGDGYGDLRTIEVKQMKAIYPDSRSMTLTVTYTKDGSTYTPNYRWDRGKAGTGETKVTLRNEPGVTSITLAKGTGYHPLASLYYTGDPLNELNIEVTYDVYDKAGTLLRANDKAESIINLPNVPVTAGKYYDVKIVIEPSYLYILSDKEKDSDGAMIIP